MRIIIKNDCFGLGFERRFIVNWNRKITKKGTCLLMSAMVASGVIAPVASVTPVFASEKEVTVSSTIDTNVKTDKAESTKSSTENTKDTKTNTQTKNTTKSAETSKISFVIKDEKDPIEIKSDTAICDAFEQIMDGCKVQGDMTGAKIDAMDLSDYRTVVFENSVDSTNNTEKKVDTEKSDSTEKEKSTEKSAKEADAQKDEESTKETTANNQLTTVKEVYDYVMKSKGCIFIVYNAKSEICRFSMTNDNEKNALSVTPIKTDTSYKVTYNANGGKVDKEFTSIRAKSEKMSHFDVTASYDGFDFAGWYDAAKDGEEVTANTKVVSDMTLYAHWKEKSFTIKFDSQGGSAVESKKVSEKDTVSNLPTPTRSGYKFDGWYTKNGTKVTEVKGDKDITLYAHWTAKKVDKLELSEHTLTVKYGDVVALKYTYSPEDATNAEFVWSSSNPNVIYVDKAKDGKEVLRCKEVGETKLTIATKDDSISDTCTVTVTKDSSDDKKDDSSTDTKKDTDDKTKTPTNNASTTDTTDKTSTDTSKDAKSDDKTSVAEPIVKQLTLNVVMTDGSTKKVTVKDNVKLSDLVQTLGFKNVESYKYRTASNHTESELKTTSTMKTIAEMAEKEEVLVIGYDSAKKAVGCGKVTKTTDGTYTVTLSKDTNVSLSTNDGKGKGEGENEGKSENPSTNPVEKTGKSDSEATPVKTSDSNVLQVYGGLAMLTAGLTGVLVCLKKKVWKK